MTASSPGAYGSNTPSATCHYSRQSAGAGNSSMKVPQLNLAGQYAALREETEQAVLRVLASQQFILGPEVEALERDVAAYAGAAYAVACASGTDALLLALMALDVGPGDEVITSPFTFFATAGCIHRLGAKPVFADIEPDSFNLDPKQVARRINSKTRAIVPVHLYGRIANMDEIVSMARGCQIPVIEDAAQALGARLAGRMAGTFGAVGCYSFYPTKNLGGAGEGGMVVTNDARLADRMRRLRSHGSHERYFHDEVGINSRLNEIQAAVLRVKLQRLEDWNRARREHAARYDEALRGVVEVPGRAPAGSHVYHQYVVRTRGRDELREHLTGRGIGTAIYYPLPLHLQKCFAHLGHAAGDFPQAEAAAQEVLALPMYPELTDEARNYVSSTIAEWAAGRTEATARAVIPGRP